MSGERPGPAEREVELEKLWKRMGKAARRGNLVRFEELSAEHDRAKAEHVRLSHEEQREEGRARRAAGAVLERPAAARWRLPFRKSPLAQERAAQAAAVPVVPASGHLSPWRRGWSPASEVLWRPDGEPANR
jgi:hypothetical protein